MLTSTFCSPALIHPESAVLRKPIHRATCLRQKAFRLTFWSRDQRQPLVHQRATLVRATDKEEAEEQKIRNPLKPEQKKEEQSLGLVGTIITWGFLAFLFAGSIFFTTARSFLPDMQPLDPNSPALMDQSD